MALDPQIATLLEQVNALPPISQGTPEMAREGFRKLTKMGAAFHPPPGVGPVTEVAVDGGDGQLPARLYMPPDA